MVSHQFKDIVNVTKSRSLGQFILSDEGLIWRPSADSSGSILVIKKDQIKDMSWCECATYAMLTVFWTKTGEEENKQYDRFDGFKVRDTEIFETMVEKVYQKELKRDSLNSAGLNVGQVSISKDKGTLQMLYKEKIDIEVPLSGISQCVATGKNDIEIHFHEDDTGPREDEMLIEMKLYVPPNDVGEDVSMELQQEIVSGAGIERITGDIICTFSEDIGTFLSPRGRYLVDMYDTFFRMQGKTYEYKIMYKSISRMFLLPKLEGTAYAFVISLDDPIQQGQQRHRHLVLQLDVRDETIEVNLPKDVIKEKYGDKISSEMNGQLQDTVAKLFKVLTGKKVFVPGAFSSALQHSAIKCALKTSPGLLYPLGRSFFFIHKPATFIRFEDIDYIEFQRYGGAGSDQASRNFDLDVRVRSVGGDSAQSYLFSSIDKREYNNLLQFLNSKRIRIKNLKTAVEAEARREEESAFSRAVDEMEEESDDEDFASGDEEPDSDSDSDSDVSLASDVGIEATKGKGSDGDEDEDEDDEDGEESGKKRKRSSSSTAKEPKEKKSTPKKAKKIPKRDPAAPKKVSLAYHLFTQDMRTEIKEKQPDLSFAEMNKLLGVRWAEASAEVKEKYGKLQEKDQERYDNEMKDYTPAEGYNKSGKLITETKPKASKKEDDGTEKKVKKKKDPNAPKSAKNSYSYFVKEQGAKIKEEQPELSFGDRNKLLGSKWKELSAEDKEKYEALAKDDKARYDKEMSTYHPPKEIKTEAAPEKTKPVKTKVKKEVKEEKKREATDGNESSSSSGSSSSGSGSSSSGSSSSGSASDSEDESKPSEKKKVKSRSSASSKGRKK
mmetsp:Transcript_36001/g.57606  ORF Transcript_36001/g.57606 Transcript_36001/m.57606 type:complete len:835 (+) Transcript_36001:284-2788(+)|eukprot:CAMPEP_0203756148 /NCGR_PEP_ID=MMETSP0098-20131031/9468_1 /ASSEMBLY_ACC=CAM_ASM_000208 /TAXON_ID=96639 /ORGANISM=" , Strain NY0313808BC1" /LENGTH=834 /DNA_ID=CAMNT_0050647903 /DNA_START=273 /DNA_END=2777 /DNA_ORIENTATION=+